jgi:NAD(P)-dependent dehydrogenase (short-subunit alcohol dehydrogenase family)
VTGPTSSPQRLAGKSAVVVGAGQTEGVAVGNGRATAVTFARHGARLLLVDRRRDAAEETAALIENEVGTRPFVHVADVTRDRDCEEVAKVALDVLGGVDILHNNVGIVGSPADPVELSEDDWDRVMATNLKAMWLTCRHVLPIMQAAGAGAIVNVSSIASVMSGASNMPYILSKTGVNSLTRSLALGYAKHNIRVNALLPGLIDTPMAVDDLARRRDVSRQVVEAERNALVPMGAMGSAWDVAQAALFLASDESRFITGVLLPVDGGQTLRIG